MWVCGFRSDIVELCSIREKMKNIFTAAMALIVTYAAYAAPEHQVAHQRLAVGAEEVRHGIPGTDQDSPSTDLLARLGRRGVLLHEVEKCVDQPHQQQTVLLERSVPFPIPMRSRYVVCNHPVFHKVGVYTS